MGEDPDGAKIKNPLPNILQLLQSSKVETQDKLRLLMEYVVIKGGISSRYDKSSPVFARNAH